MMMSRREFVGAAALATVLPRISGLTAAASTASCRVLDLGEHCSLRESVAGYRIAMSRLEPRVPILIVPAALALPMLEIDRHLRYGGTVILESGAMFTDDEAAGRHREALRALLDIRADAPLDLWPRRTPYVQYEWPLEAMVRDFSRAIPLLPQPGATIGTADGLPVALRRSIGSGQLLFLGSPLGPALSYRDAHAERWLEAATRE